MILDTSISIDKSSLVRILEEEHLPYGTRLMASDTTVSALTGKHFYDVRCQTFMGYPIIEDHNCALGEVIILVNYEHYRNKE